MLHTLLTLPVLGLAALARAQGELDCGIPGYDLNTPEAYWASDNETSVAGCQALCVGALELTEVACEAFAFGAGQCLLYNVTLENNLNPVNESAYVFYDVDCVLPTAPVQLPADAFE